MRNDALKPTASVIISHMLHAAVSLIEITHKGKCTISDSELELGGLSTNVLDVLTARENMP